MYDPEDEFDFTGARARMVREQLERRNIGDPAVLRAMAAVPRHAFVDPSEWDEAYADHPLRIGCRQTISQPYMVAYMSQALQLEPEMKVLEIGTGCGYQTAVLAQMGARVYTVERHAPLSAQAEERLATLGLADDVAFHVGDGTLGWEEHVPYERILVTAAAPHMPTVLQGQLAEKGRMVVPVGRGTQALQIVTRRDDRFEQERDITCVFVPLVGRDGASE